MDNLLHLSASPHIHSGRSTSSIMRDVLIALLPAAVAGTVIFGLRSLLVIAVCVGSCVALEALFQLITKKDQTVGDLSAAVTGLLLALNLPANIPIWQCIIGCAVAILLVKCLFGGIGCNQVNPAITARVFMLVSFGTMAVQAMPVVVDTVAGATPLEQIAQGNTPNLLDLFLGTTGGAIGETCALALLLGFVY
ncbi:MAG: RnfABCDGE type electron transport complex subunit D, partial [Clostridia bacterium]|nr:RnfABCDGE type electron transport complex subunit D [Clostridia bacterium]